MVELSLDEVPMGGRGSAELQLGRPVSTGKRVGSWGRDDAKALDTLQGCLERQESEPHSQT